MTILDVQLDEGASFAHQIPSGQTAWILSVDGSLGLQNNQSSLSLDAGSSVTVCAGDSSCDLIIGGKSRVHFVLLQAEPLREPFVQRGPFAMSTEQEVDAMFAAHAAGELGSIDKT